MPTKDFSGLPHTDDERLQAAYDALVSLDKLPPSVDALAKLTGYNCKNKDHENVYNAAHSEV